MEVKDKGWLARQINPVIDNGYLDVHFFNLLYLICINRFKWTNLPNGIDPDYIEKTLATQGEVAFFKDKTFGLCVTKCTGEYLNIYGRPTAYVCFSDNNEIYDIKEADEVVIIRNNKLSQPSFDFLRRYADVIGDIQKTKEINLNALKTPIHITVDEAQKTTLENIYQQYRDGFPVIMTNKLFDPKSLSVLRTDAPYLLDKLQTEKMENFNECLMFQGINTIPLKKERMITSEVDKTTQMVDICLSMFLNPRLEARDMINKKFGCNIGLELAEYCKSEVNNIPDEDIKGGSDNE